MEKANLTPWLDYLEHLERLENQRLSRSRYCPYDEDGYCDPDEEWAEDWDLCSDEEWDDCGEPVNVPMVVDLRDYLDAVERLNIFADEDGH
jgi:hypothetical protein